MDESECCDHKAVKKRSNNQKCKWIVQINNYSGALREVLTRELTEIGDEKVAWIEIFFEDKKRIRDPFSSFSAIPFEFANEYSVFLRINMFNHSLFHNDRISLQELTYLFKDHLKG